MKKLKTMKYLSATVLIGAILMLLMLVLPFASAKGDYREELLEYKKEIYIEGDSLTNGDVMEMSLLEFARAYVACVKMDYYVENSITCIVLISIFGVSGIGALLMAIYQKKVGSIVFNILATVSFALIQFDFKGRGVMPSSFNAPGIVNYLVYIIGIIVIVVASIMIKREKIEELEEVRQYIDKQD